MKKIALFFFTFCILTNAAAVRAGITFAVDAANDELPEYRIQGMSMEQRREYCTGFGFKLMSCTDPYMPEALCRADPSYASKCICRPEYNLECKETDGLRGVGTKCDGKYAQCCKLICKNPYATLLSCKDQGLEEIHSERDYNECGETCYVCKDKCVKGTPEDQCPNGQKCIPIPRRHQPSGQALLPMRLSGGAKRMHGLLRSAKRMLSRLQRRL